MNGQPKTVQEILLARLAIAQEISAATAEHLRLMQLIGGLQVLELGDTGSAAHSADLARHQEVLDACERKIDGLQRQMAGLDEELDGKAQGGDT